jgi:acetyl-CoA carboxylase carboxyltransferase component
VEVLREAHAARHVRAAAQLVPGCSPPRYRLLDVVGAEDGIGVECLSGSAAIASAFCRAWREGYTATLVSGRCAARSGVGGRL